MTILACNNSSVIKNQSLTSSTPFGVCYAKVSPDQVRNYKMVIIEPDFYSKGEIQALKQNGTKVIAYITLGEVDKNRWYYPKLEQIGFLGTNESWGSSYLNLKEQEVISIILDRVLPEIILKGVDGIFLDTVDAVAPYTERKDLEPNMVALIKEIRARHPEITIIQNAGLFLLDETHTDVDAVLIEDIASGYDFVKKSYYIKDLAQFNERKDLVISTANEYNIPVFILDFSITKPGISEIKSRLDTLGVPYFISDINLTQLPDRPSTVANKVRVK